MFFRPLAFVSLLTGCAAPRALMIPATPSLQNVELFDPARRRPVPVLLYGAPRLGRAKPLAIISHGYGGHKGDYAFIAAPLVRRGYVVASIEHLDRPGDPPMANGDNLAVRRRPVWQVGADSIGFVMEELRRRGIADSRGVVLIGHSNGGDMTMLFSAQRPSEVRAALSLDHRRMPVPRTAKPRICSARSTDFAADPGVLPTRSEQEALGMVIADVPVTHDQMSDRASAQQREAMLDVLSTCLNSDRG